MTKIEQLIEEIKLNKQIKTQDNLKITNYIRNDLFNRMKVYFDNTDAININCAKTLHEEVFSFEFYFNFKNLVHKTIIFEVELFKQNHLLILKCLDNNKKVYCNIYHSIANEFQYNLDYDLDYDLESSKLFVIEDFIYNYLVEINS